MSATVGMRPSYPGSRLTTILLAGSLMVPCLYGAPRPEAAFGRLAGTVSDSQGNPLMGATVLIMGPVLASTAGAGASLERILTDARGQFKLERLAPGWYSLRVTAPTRVPALRSGIRVEAGETATEKFVLADIFAPLRFQVPNQTVTSWGDDWKWVLRTSPATRPVLRYQQEVVQASAKAPKLPLPASRRLIGMMPGSARRDPLAGDPGLGSVLAYLRPLSPDADLLVAGSMTASGVWASSLATAFRRNMIKGDPQELALVVHQLGFADGVPYPASDGRGGMSRAQGVVASYTQSRRLGDNVTMTAGMVVDYLDAVRDVIAAQPHAKVEYRVNPATLVAIQYGSGRAEGSDTLLERVGMLNTFPRVTLRNYRPRLEQLNHTEVSLKRALNKTSRLELAAYRDEVHNAAVWGLGQAQSVPGLAGNVLPNPTVNGLVLNAGNYHSSGLRAAYAQKLGDQVEAMVAYAVGDALAVQSAGSHMPEAYLRGLLRARQSASLAGKVSAVIPVAHTRFTTSYVWVQRDRVTVVDPYGQADLQLQPFLGLQIRQPLPTLAFLPAHIEALLDFRNLLAQGYVPLAQAGDRPLLLSSAYRCFRGGFSVQF